MRLHNLIPVSVRQMFRPLTPAELMLRQLRQAERYYVEQRAALECAEFAVKLAVARIQRLRSELNLDRTALPAQPPAAEPAQDAS